MLSTLVRSRATRRLSTTRLIHSTLNRTFPSSSSLPSLLSLRTLSSPSKAPLLPSLTPRLILHPFSSPFQPRFSSSSSSSLPPPPPHSSPSLSLTQRLKLLFKTHGWTALTLYLVLSFIDFSLTFLLVYSIGAERVREFEDYILESLGWRRHHGEGEKGVLRRKVEEWKENHRHPEKLNPVNEIKEVREGKPVELGMSEKELMLKSGKGKKPEGYSAYATTAVLAYAIHKTALLPVRVGLTVWVTPKVVRLLRGWGWNVGQVPVTAATAARAAGQGTKP